MLHLTIITVNVLSIFFQIYKIEGVENKYSFFSLRFALRTLMCHLTDMLFIENVILYIIKLGQLNNLTIYSDF